MSNSIQNNPLFISIRQLVEESKQQVVVAVNATMSMLYWRIGGAINEELKKFEGEQNYGKQIVDNYKTNTEHLFLRKIYAG